MAIVEFVIEITLDATAPFEQHGVRTGSETLVNECVYFKGTDAGDTLSSVAESLRRVLDLVERRMEEEDDRLLERRS